MKAFVFILGILASCFSDTTGTPFDVGEVLDVSLEHDMMIDIADDSPDLPEFNLASGLNAFQTMTQSSAKMSRRSI